MISSNKKLLVLIIVIVITLGLCLTAALTIGKDSKYYVVFSDSMTPTLNTGDIVIAEEERNSRSFANLKIGDIIVFVAPEHTGMDKEPIKTIVHRVVGIEADPNGARLVRTKGDANTHSIQALDFPITKENYIGKVTHVIPYLGPMLMYFDLIIRVFIHPLLYVIIGAIISVIFVFELRKRQSIPTKS